MIYLSFYLALLITIILINKKHRPMKQLTDNEKEIILELVSNHAICEPSDIDEYTRLEQDLTLDSLDIVELVMRIEQEFNIQIADSDIEDIKTVGDIYKYVAEQL